MVECNATLTVGGETLTCNDHSIFADDHGWFTKKGAPTLTWTDGVPGATPHKDPVPDLHIYCRVAERARERERDEARAEAEEHRVRANENFDEALRWRSEADRYRKALERIARTHPSQAVVSAGVYARRVLDGGDA